MKRYCVYKHYSDGKLFYVGCGLISRSLNISSRPDRWVNVYSSSESFAVEVCKTFDTKQEALDAEGDLISTFHPAANYNGSSFCTGGDFSIDHLNLPSNHADLISQLQKKNDDLESLYDNQCEYEGELKGSIDDAEDLLIEARDSMNLALDDIKNLLRPDSSKTTTEDL